MQNVLFDDHEEALFEKINASYHDQFVKNNMLKSIDEVGGISVDAYVTDAMKNLIFISIQGLDTSLTEFLAGITLQDAADGLESFRIIQGNEVNQVHIRNHRTLDKETRRFSDNNMLVHMQIYDRIVKYPDRSNCKAVMLYRFDEPQENINDRLWSLVKLICHLPLLDYWRDIILTFFTERGWITELPAAGMGGKSIDLSSPEVNASISAMLKVDTLVCEESEQRPLSEFEVKDPLQEYFGEMISSYSREQALEDGVLIDVTETAKEAGIVIPVALTSSAYEDCVSWTSEDTKKQTPQDVSGRLWDVLWMASDAMRRNRQQSDKLLFDLYRVPRDGKTRKPILTTLKVLIGPGDNHEPVLTIMMPNED